MPPRPPRWFAALLGVVSVVFLALAGVVTYAAARGPVGLWALALAAWLVGGFAAAIALIGTRGVVVDGETVRVTGFRHHDFVGDELVGEPVQGLLGVPLRDGRTTRYVFAQLPYSTAELVESLPQRFPHLRRPLSFPVVLPGRISTPVAYGFGALLVAALGGWATVQGVVGPPPGGPSRLVLVLVGLPMSVLGAGTLAWALRRAERRVEVHERCVVHVHIVGRRTRALGPFAAATVVRSARTLPRSRLEREVHHLRLTDVRGEIVELAPMLAAFPDYGAAEGRLLGDRAWRLHRLHGTPVRYVELLRSPHGTVAWWDHGESSPGAHRHTLVLPRAVDGRRAVPFLHGRAAVGGSVADLVATYDDRMLVLVDLAAGSVRHVALDSPARSLEPGCRRVVTADGPVDLAALASAAVDGWPRRWGPLGVPMTPWMPALERLLDAVDQLGDEERSAAERLLAVRAHEAVSSLLASSTDERAAAALPSALEVAGLDEPSPSTV